MNEILPHGGIGDWHLEVMGLWAKGIRNIPHGQKQLSNVIKPPYTKNQGSSRILHRLAVHKRSRQTCKNTFKEIQVIVNLPMHQKKFRLNKVFPNQQNLTELKISFDRYAKHVDTESF